MEVACPALSGCCLAFKLLSALCTEKSSVQDVTQLTSGLVL